jgi:hypothetical protein
MYKEIEYAAISFLYFSWCLLFLALSIVLRRGVVVLLFFQPLAFVLLYCVLALFVLS